MIVPSAAFRQFPGHEVIFLFAVLASKYFRTVFLCFDAVHYPITARRSGGVTVVHGIWLNIFMIVERWFDYVESRMSIQILLHKVSSAEFSIDAGFIEYGDRAIQGRDLLIAVGRRVAARLHLELDLRREEALVCTRDGLDGRLIELLGDGVRNLAIGYIECL